MILPSVFRHGFRASCIERISVAWSLEIKRHFKNESVIKEIHKLLLFDSEEQT